MPVAYRREIRRRQQRRAHRRRRVRLVGSAGVLVVALALILLAAPGAYAPAEQVTLALTSGDLVGRLSQSASRSVERSPEPEAVPVPEQSTTDAAPPPPEAAPATTDARPEPPPAVPSGTQPSPQAQPPGRPAAAPASSGGDTAAVMAADVVVLTNAERAAAGLPELAVDACATEQAAARSALLVAEGRFEHDPLGPILDACAARTVGENLSLGYPSAQAAVVGWMNSPGHRANILRTSFSQIGVACTQGGRGWLCAQVFLG